MSLLAVLAFVLVLCDCLICCAIDSWNAMMLDCGMTGMGDTVGPVPVPLPVPLTPAATFGDGAGATAGPEEEEEEDEKLSPSGPSGGLEEPNANGKGGWGLVECGCSCWCCCCCGMAHPAFFCCSSNIFLRLSGVSCRGCELVM